MSSPFKRLAAEKPKSKTPEELFADLNGRDASIKGLLSQQADVLRAYAQTFSDQSDVALELPTGSGKTLVGLLVAEWRRRVRGERALYLCPTVQLVHQVADKARLYGIDCVKFVGSKDDFEPADVQAYNTGAKIAIAPYARTFNVKPGIADPNFIVLDDAHAAEQYVAGMWSLVVDEATPEILASLLGAMKPFLPAAFVDRLDEPSTKFRSQSLELLPVHARETANKTLREVLDAALSGGKPRNLYFRWETLRAHIHACNVFVSAEEVLIRPYIPPSMKHAPFATAKQRFYLSATLGPAGSLERMVGVPRITRMPTPPLLKGGGTGRRFFLFPSASMGPGEAIGWALDQAKARSRSLVVCRDHSTRRAIAKTLKAKGVAILSADDVENSLDPFLKSSNTALVVASRFDGIDLPEEACRITVMHGVPSAINLQERFFLTRLGMNDLLRDRIVTRFMQAAGRCTRGATDYSLVLPATQDLLDFAARRENRMAMHPVLAAEVGFGLEQSAQEPAVLDAMTAAFFGQTADWKEVDQQIQRYHEPDEGKVSVEAQALVMKCAAHEVEHAYAIWAGPDHVRAADLARRIADAATLPGLNLYRAWWAYQAGCSHWFLSQDGKDAEQITLAEQFFNVARGAAGLASWYSNVPHVVKGSKSGPAEVQAHGVQVDNILDVLRDLGIRGPRFEAEVEAPRSLLNQNKAENFERGVEQLGRLLGFESKRPGVDGAPDGVWRLEGCASVAFEAKTEKEAKNPVNKSDCTQAAGHRGFVKTTYGDDPLSVRVVIVAENRAVHQTAIPHVEDLHYMAPKDLLKLLERVAAVLRRVRNDSADLDSPEARERLATWLTGAGLWGEAVVEHLTETPLGKVPVAAV